MPVQLDQYRHLLAELPVAVAPIQTRLDPVATAPSRATPTSQALDDFVTTYIERPNPELSEALGGRLTTIPFRYIVDGCYARAHIMAALLERHDIDNAKIFALGHLSASNPDFPRGVSWGYHVAPLVVVTSGAGLALRVVDPALHAEPLEAAAWIRAIDPSGRSVEIRCRERAAYYPRGGTPATFEQNLPAARNTLVKYAGRLRGHLDLLSELAGADALAAAALGVARHEHTGIPARIDREEMALELDDSAVLYRIPTETELGLLEEAMRTSREVSVVAEPETGMIVNLSFC